MTLPFDFCGLQFDFAQERTYGGNIRWGDHRFTHTHLPDQITRHSHGSAFEHKGYLLRLFVRVRVFLCFILRVVRARYVSISLAVNFRIPTLFTLYGSTRVFSSSIFNLECVPRCHFLDPFIYARRLAALERLSSEGAPGGRAIVFDFDCDSLAVSSFHLYILTIFYPSPIYLSIADFVKENVKT